MKLGFGFGIVMIIFTIIFATIALQNNKIARKIVVKEFNVHKTKKTESKRANEVNCSKSSVNEVDNFDANWKKSRKEFAKQWNDFGN